jgi:hypothetical protein
MRKYWSDKEVKFLIANKDKNLMWLSKKLNRSQASIKQRLIHLKLSNYRYCVVLKVRAYDKIKEFNNKGVNPTLLQLCTSLDYSTKQYLLSNSGLSQAVRVLISEGVIVKLKFDRFMVSKAPIKVGATLLKENPLIT